MKILCIADTETRELWDFWDTAGRRRTEGVQLILSAGDLRAEYLEFFVTMLGVPCLYVRGNHDTRYHKRPPEGCLCIEGKVACIYEDPETGRAVVMEESVTDEVRARTRAKLAARVRSMKDGDGSSIIRVAGLGGSRRYHDGPDMYTEREMARRVRRLERRFDSSLPAAGDVSILLTHAPCFGHGDMEDLPHTGFACFNSLLERKDFDYQIYGHVHMEYGMFKRELQHPAGTGLINVSGMYILEI